MSLDPGGEPSDKGSARAVAISLDRGCLLRGGRDIRLRAKTFQVLVYLHEHPGKLVAKEDAVSGGLARHVRLR